MVWSRLVKVVNHVSLGPGFSAFWFHTGKAEQAFVAISSIHFVASQFVCILLVDLMF